MAGSTGAYSLYRESTWTPLLIVGAHPRLPRGRHDDIVTLLDVAPTIADLLGLREANPWHGHSLLAVRAGPAASASASATRVTAEAGGWSAVSDGHGRPAAPLRRPHGLAAAPRSRPPAPALWRGACSTRRSAAAGSTTI